MKTAGIWALAGILFLTLSVGCAGGKGKQKPAELAARQVETVNTVLGDMAGALKSGDVAALAGQWRDDRRAGARARIELGLSRGPVRDVRFTLLGVRAEAGRLTARVTWDGTRQGESVAGTFQLELEAGPPPRVVAITGSDPVSGGAGQVDVPDGALQ
ncbi:MAG: hypothetical protein OEW11_02805 [Nitrospirota bacterium]|nr:hypothetical protein [Nitrospirota bacterium]